MGNGYMGKILNVHLGTGLVAEEILAEEVYEKYTSGMGLAAWLLYDRIPAQADPLGPDNILGFVSGLLTGTNAFFTGRWMAVGKSPLTGGWGDANSGGWFSYALKKSGYDGVFFYGVSAAPVYLKIWDGRAELVDASHLWGLDTAATDDRIKAEVGHKVQVAAIGQAGEKMSLLAGIVTDKARVAARSGLGAVMGSKKLKALAVGGRQKIRTADPARVRILNAEFKQWFDNGQMLSRFLGPRTLNLFGRVVRVSPVALAQSGDLTKVALRKYGTCATNVLSSECGDSPVRNWNGSGVKDFGIRPHANQINPRRIIDYQIKRYHCHSCPLGCGGVMEINDGPYPLTKTHKPEYETCCAFGTLILNDDIYSIFKINDMLNRAGMDTIGAGAVVAWALECHENGLLSTEDLDGIDLAWGNSEAVIRIVRKMIARDGIGDLLADGCKRASERLSGSDTCAMHAGGQELPMHDPRFDPGFAISYVLEPTPGRHTSHGYQWIEMYGLNALFKDLPKLPTVSLTRGKYRPDDIRNLHMVTASRYMQFVNGVGGCLFGVQMAGKLKLTEYVNAVTGWNHPPEHYLLIGERIQNLRQAFNVKHGIVPLRDFALPMRVLGSPPLDSGPMKNVCMDVKSLYDAFLEGMGWNRDTAIPTRAKLEELGLTQVEMRTHI